MAAHVRKQIRDYVRALLAAAGTDAGSNVFAARVHTLQSGELPAILVDTTAGGEIRAGSLGGVDRYVERALILTIGVAVKSVSGYQDTLDEIYKDIETALAADNGLGGLCKYVQPTAEPEVSLDAESDRPVARAEMPFEVFYVTALNAPDQPR